MTNSGNMSVPPVFEIGWVGGVMLAVPIIGNDVIFTLYGVYSFGLFFHSNNNF